MPVYNVRAQYLWKPAEGVRAPGAADPGFVGATVRELRTESRSAAKADSALSN